MSTDHHALAPLSHRGGAGRRVHLSASKGSGAPSSRRLALPLALLACLLTLAFSAAAAQALVTHRYLCQITGAGSASTSATECDTNPNPAENPPVSGVEVRAPGSLGSANAITFDSGNLWLAERVEGTRLSVVNRFDSSSDAFLSRLAQGADFEALHLAIAVGHAAGEAQIYVGHPGGVAAFDEAGTRQGDWTGADTPSGSFGGGIDVAVDESTSLADLAAGDVYVADPSNAVVDIFKSKAAGAEEYFAQLTGPELGSPFNAPEQIAVDQANGNLLVVDGGSTVDVFEPTAPGEYAFLHQISTTPFGPLTGITGLAIDSGNGDIYVRQGDIIFQFDSAGTYLGRLAATSAVPLANVGGIAVDPATHRLYLGSYAGFPNNGVVDVFGPSVVIPDVTTEPVSNLQPTSATFNGTVNPASAGPATCQFAWGTSPELGHIAPCNAPIPDGNSPVPVQVALELLPDNTYFYRLQAENSGGILNEGESAQTQEFSTPGPGIHTTSVSAVSSDSATLEATIDPNNSPTTYYFQYGTDADYGTDIPASPGASIGSGAGDVEVNRYVGSLPAGTNFHYRVVAVSEISPGHFESFDGPDHAFITQVASPFSLADARRWELVSPPDKHGATIGPIGEVGVIQAAAAGNAVSYFTDHPTEREPLGNVTQVQVFSSRTPGGWASHDIATKHDEVAGQSVGQGYEYRFFSADLSLALVEPYGFGFNSLASEAFPPDTERTVYLRHNATCESTPATCYLPLLTAAPGYADLPEGTKFGGNPTNNFGVVRFEGATSDLSHVILQSPVALTPIPLPNGAGTALYEWSRSAPPAEALQLVSLLPATEGGGATFGYLGYGVNGTAKAPHATSADGSRIVWTAASGGTALALYLRDTSKDETLRLDLPQPGAGKGGAAPVFQSAAADGSRVFFTDTQQLTPQSSSGPDLYECEIVEEAAKDACNLSDLTPSAGQPAEVLGGIAGASENGSDVYFVADGVLADNVVENGAGVEEAQPGTCSNEPVFQPASVTCNLYLSHAGSISFIATLSSADSPDWEKGVIGGLPRRTSRVSPSGQWLAFMSQLPLTGYDNRDAVSGQRDEEVFLYDSATEKLICASCNPTAARPHGIEYGKNGNQGEPNLPLVGGDRIWPANTWLAANVPGWTPVKNGVSLYQSRYLSNSGRLFFDSSDALVPQDSNGTEDVYEYEPPGVGGCTESRPTFSQASDGCLDLVSSGTSAEESAFLDASENGDDIFFLTAARLAPTDHDTSLDVYDAHVCSSASPCPPPPSAPAPLCEGDACQPPAEAPNDPTPGSLTFHGAGNLVECPKGKLKKGGKCVKQTAKKKHKHHKKSKKRHATFNRRASR